VKSVAEKSKKKSQLMNKKIVAKVVIFFLCTVNTCLAVGCTANSAGSQLKGCDVNSVDGILRNLSQSTAELKSYQCRIEYKFSQPLLESETLRKGVLYYQRCDGKSALRINFQTLKQDDEEEQKYIEQYIFDGVWLTHIDYQIKQVKRYQQTEPNEPVGAFDLVSRNFPIIGFTKIEDLKKQFEIKLVKQKKGKAQLHLKVKADSIYKNDYTSVDLWVDKKSYLPAAIRAISTEEDFYAIKLLDAKVNEKIGKEVFEIKIPKGFGEEVVPLKKKD
jgi:outer membrane lipoprotein-sorting protein